MNHSYTVTLSGMRGDLDLWLYKDHWIKSLGSSTAPGTTNEVVTAIANSEVLFIEVDSLSGGNEFTIAVVDNGLVASEGSVAAPVSIGKVRQFSSTRL